MKNTSRRGLRKDLKLYVRSSWEANYARYLNLLVACGKIVEWGYEKRRFMFSDIKRGTRSYLPDFQVKRLDGSIEYHEVKGYWTQRGRTAVKRFRKRYPEYRLLIINTHRYKRLERWFAKRIPKWEEA